MGPRANRYDLHPVVRGVVWSMVGVSDRQQIHETLRAHFEAFPTLDKQQPRSIEDYAPALELYNNLTALGRYDDAAMLFSYELSRLYQVDASLTVELLEQLFEPGVALGVAGEEKGELLQDLGVGYVVSGRPDRMSDRMQGALKLLSRAWDRVYPLSFLSEGLLCTGRIRGAEAAARAALIDAREADPRWFQPVALHHLAACLVARGDPDALLCINRAQVMFQRRRHTDWAARSRLYGVQLLLWQGYAEDAAGIAESILDGAGRDPKLGFKTVVVPCLRLAALANIGLGDFVKAEERLEQAFTRAHTMHSVEDEIAALIALAELKRRLHDSHAAKRLLEDAGALADRGSYRLHQADIQNVRARIAWDERDRDRGLAAASKAYCLAWCDGPPFTYQRTLLEAAALMHMWGSALPPVDESPAGEEIPSVEINPSDEWFTDPDKYSATLIGGFAEPEP